MGLGSGGVASGLVTHIYRKVGVAEFSQRTVSIEGFEIEMSKNG